MKKLILSIALLTAVLTSQAQENMLSKRGTSIIPEKGDFAIGFDAAPFFKYLGNMFNQNGNEAPYANFIVPYTFTGLWVKGDNWAYRATVTVGFGTAKTDTVVLLNGSNPNAITTTDTRKVSGSNIVLGVGKQWYRGKHRVRANYGADALISYSGNKTTYDYGQALSDTNPVGPRVTEIKDGSGFGLGVRGFINVEYFFAPKISLSAGYGWGLSFSSIGKGKSTVESFNPTNSEIKTKTTDVGASSEFAFGTWNDSANPRSIGVDNFGGTIKLSFYF